MKQRCFAELQDITVNPDLIYQKFNFREKNVMQFSLDGEIRASNVVE